MNGRHAPAAAPPRVTPFVGREREMAILRRAVDEVLEGRGQMVPVIGEAGLGKSRVIEETRAYWHRDGRRTPSTGATSTAYGRRGSAFPTTPPSPMRSTVDDGGLYFYIQDMIVLPELPAQGFGRPDDGASNAVPQRRRPARGVRGPDGCGGRRGVLRAIRLPASGGRSPRHVRRVGPVRRSPRPTLAVAHRERGAAPSAAAAGPMGSSHSKALHGRSSETSSGARQRPARPGVTGSAGVGGRRTASGPSSGDRAAAEAEDAHSRTQPSSAINRRA